MILFHLLSECFNSFVDKSLYLVGCPFGRVSYCLLYLDVNCTVACFVRWFVVFRFGDRCWWWCLNFWCFRNDVLADSLFQLCLSTVNLIANVHFFPILPWIFKSFSACLVELFWLFCWFRLLPWPAVLSPDLTIAFPTFFARDGFDLFRFLFFLD